MSLQQQAWRISFSREIRPEEKLGLAQALGMGLVQANRILEAHSRVKRFYKVQTETVAVFVKLREFNSWARRLGRALRPTKEERELANYGLLRSLGVPCPRPLASAKLQKGSLPRASVLVTQFLEHTRPLKELLLGPQGPLLLEPLGNFLGLLKKAGILHQDLQWENILAGSLREGFPLYLVDPLHVRAAAGQGDLGFSMSLAWFLGFMLRGGAAQELVGLLAGHMVRLGLCNPWDQEELLLRARELAAP